MLGASAKKYFPVILLPVCALLASCNSETGQLAGGGIGGTGITSGMVTGFGSVFVNGIEFDTTGAVRDIDDVLTISTGADDDTVMGSGMVVTVAGTVNPDGRTGSVTGITYDAAVLGPIAAAPDEDPDRVHKTFTVLDLTIVADRNNTVFVNTDYQSILMDDVIEVSGFVDNTGALVATRLEKEGVLGPGTVVGIRGIVNGYDGSSAFMIGTLGVVFDGTTVFEDLPGTVADGQYVEVGGTLLGPASIQASRIELENSIASHAGVISMEGIVTSFVDVGNFLLDGLPVDASHAGFTPTSLAGTLANNQRIEVEGTIAGGMIRADRVEQRTGVVKLAGAVTATDAGGGTISIEIVMGQAPMVVMVDSQTWLEDELLQLRPFTLAQMATGDPVQVQGYIDNTGRIVAGVIKRRVLDEYQLTGPVSAASGTSSSGSVTILGITMPTDGATEFEDSNDQPFPGGGGDFYSQVKPGDIVELEDSVPVDGIADEVELGD